MHTRWRVQEFLLLSIDYCVSSTMVRLRLRELAEAQNLNISQVQRRTGLTMGMVRRYWYNQTTQVDLRAISELACLLKVTPGELFTDELGDSTDDEGDV